MSLETARKVLQTELEARLFGGATLQGCHFLAFLFSCHSERSEEPACEQ